MSVFAGQGRFGGTETGRNVRYNETSPQVLQTHCGDSPSQFDLTERRASMKPISAALAASLAPTILRRIRVDEDGCWIRTSYVNPVTGYTTVARKAGGESHYYLAHRVMYVYGNGPIPDGLTIDHACNKPACCNPEHLRPMTMRENVLRSNNFYAVNARKTHCPRGHELLPNSGGPGKRRCKICASIRNAEAHRRRRLSGVPDGEPHGTRRSYHYWSCRCEECREWQREDYRARKGGAA